MTQVQIETATGAILGVGDFPVGAPTSGITIIDMTPQIQAALGQPSKLRVLNGDGTVTVTPPDPVPPRKALIQQVTVEDFRTINATIVTLVAWPLAAQTLYTARFTLTAIDTVNADCKVWTAKVSAKRVSNGAALVGTPTLDPPHPDPGAAAWAVAADVSGNNFRVRVTGAAGRIISWSLLGEVVRARPDGLVD